VKRETLQLEAVEHLDERLGEGVPLRQIQALPVGEERPAILR